MFAWHASAAPAILILGGGTAGWMSALLLQRAFPGARISLIESSRVGTIGVGEGSTPALKSFFDAVGIAEEQWMSACAATFKSGIRFDAWSRRSGFSSYFHPFYTQFDRDHVRGLDFNAALRRSGHDVHAHPDAFCYSAYLAKRRLCPIPPANFPFEVQYGYHFHSGRLAAFMKEVAIGRGVVWRDCDIASVERDREGNVASLVSNAGEVYPADFFIDCSGFAALIARGALGVGFCSFDDTLFNDRAVTLATPREAVVSTQTRATALGGGWAWHIPQQDRVGNGYVYSSRHSSDDKAAHDLCQHLALCGKEGDLRVIRFATGRLDKVWTRNCLAVGLAQGFLEPLEATALALVQLTLARFIRYCQTMPDPTTAAARLNADVADAFDGVKDYIHTHYLTSDRDDTDYWRECRSNGGGASDRLKFVLETWFRGGALREALHETGLGKHYKFNSWIYLLAGMGIYPPPSELKPASSDILRKIPLDAIEEFFTRCASNHCSQIDALARLGAGEPAEPRATPRRDRNALDQMLGLDFAQAYPASWQ